MKFSISVYDRKYDGWRAPDGHFSLGLPVDPHVVTERYTSYNTYLYHDAILDEAGKPKVIQKTGYYPPQRNWFTDADSWQQINEMVWERIVQKAEWYIDFNSLEELYAFVTEHPCSVEFDSEPHLQFYEWPAYGNQGNAHE